MLWPKYQEAYQIALSRTSTPVAPWFVVPANNKWYARWAVQALLLDALRTLNPQWPAATYDVAEQQARLRPKRLELKAVSKRRSTSRLNR